ncbi:MAG: amidase [Bdellovibrionaceae bacterium]|nr:amidase [Pseudobdellovibrionaceae bacterium]
MDEILSKSGLQIGELIRTKKISVEEVYRLHAELVTRFNPVLNAVVESNIDRGLQKARQLDTELKNHTLESKPYYGVPYTCKEMISIKGFHRTGGNYFYKDEVSLETGTTAERLSNQDMVLLGTTNVPEFGFWFETKNTIYGRTKNPYNERKTSGGSSGGEGAIIGLGASPLGIGSDIGGSIRIPAFFCGIFGHKPSYKLVPLTGHFPNSAQKLSEMALEEYPLTTIGPMCRRAEDLLPLLKIMAGADGFDRQAVANHGPLLSKSPRLKTVYFLSDPIIHGTTRTSAEVKKTVENAAQYFEQLGHNVVEIKTGFFKDALKMWSSRLSHSQRASFAELISPHKTLAPLEEVSKLILGQSKHTLPAFILSQLDGRAIDRESIQHHQEQLSLFKSEINQLLGEHNILLFPTQPRSAPYHNELFLSPFDFVYAGIFNALELPVTQAPIKLDAKKMPIGVQIVGSWGNDVLTIQAATQLESAFGGWQPPQFYS